MLNAAPVVLFSYKRPDHTKRTLECLRENELARFSDLIVYSDAPKTRADKPGVDSVRELLARVDGFKSVKVIERHTNHGLAKSITTGVSDVIESHGKIIVVEDDVVSSKYFLNFMNKSLETFKENKEVWHVSGFNYPMRMRVGADAFFWRLMICWGWGTWADRWKHFTRDSERLIEEFDEQDIFRFNLNGSHDFWRQILDNQSGKIDTWAIYWYATIFEQNGLCLNPVGSYCSNIGADGSGEHGARKGAKKKFEAMQLSEKRDLVYPEIIKESPEALLAFEKYIKSLKGGRARNFRNKKKKILGRLKRIFFNN